MSRETEELQKIIDTHNRIVFFGGAGVSTESGIPDFRSQDGLYNMKYKYPPELIISHTFFVHQPEEFYRFYRDRILITDVEPNPAHKKLAELEAAGKLTAVVTQNIDGLHQKAGSRTVYELHGSIHRNYCTRCHKFFGPEYIRDHEPVPKCDDCGGTVKPAGLIDYFRGDKLVLINKSATGRDSAADLVIREPIGQVFSQITVR